MDRAVQYVGHPYVAGVFDVVERTTSSPSVVRADPIEAWYDRVGDGAWRLARGRTGSDAAARDIVVQAFVECAEAGRCDDVDLLRCVLERVRQARPVVTHDSTHTERRRCSDVRDAFELIFVGGARIADVARAFGMTSRELSRKLADSVREHQAVPTS